MTNTDNSAGDGNILHLTDRTFAETVNSGITIVDYWAEWCHPCHQVAPHFKALSEDPKYAGKVKFAKVDTDNNPMVASQYSIISIPTFMVFKDGEAIAQQSGAMPKPMLEQFLDQALNLAE